MDQGAGQERAGLPLGWEPRGRLLDGLLGRTSGPVQCLPAASSITAVSQRGMRLLTASTGLINRCPRARRRGTPPGESLAPMGCPPTAWVGPDLSSGVPKTHPVTPETDQRLPIRTRQSRELSSPSNPCRQRCSHPLDAPSCRDGQWLGWKKGRLHLGARKGEMGHQHPVNVISTL